MLLKRMFGIIAAGLLALLMGVQVCAAPVEEAFFKKDKVVEVPIIMYHLVTKNGALIGKYGITPDEFESDLKYLQENGYHTVVMADLIAFVYRGRALPDKPVVLTFDDGNNSDFQYIFPLLKSYEMKAVVSIIGKPTDEYTEAAKKNDKARFPNLTWPQIRTMTHGQTVEIQNHSYNLHGDIGSAKRKDESVAAYRERLKKDLSHLQTRCKEELRHTPTTFTYPLGRISESAREVLDELGFRASLSCAAGMNTLQPGNPECLFKMKRCIRPSGRSVGTVLERLSKAESAQ